MDNGATSKDHQEKNLQNTRQIAVLRGKHDSNPVENSKSSTQNSDNPQNKFDLPSFKCDSCSYESIWKHAVKRHQQTHYKIQGNTEESKKAKYKCQTCSYMTSNRAMLKDHHQERHVRKTKNVLKIEDLQFTLSIKEQNGDIRNNQKKIDIYKCKKCKYKTNYRVIFESHQKVHRQNKGEEVFWCDLCTFSSLYRQSFLRHMRTMHENKLNSDNDVDCLESFENHEEMLAEKKKMDDILQINRNIEEDTTYRQDDHIQYAQTENNNLPGQHANSVKSHETTTTTGPSSISIQKSIAKPRRGKYSDVPVKITKNGLFECQHCSYQTAIRTALVKHQKNHLKNAHS